MRRPASRSLVVLSILLGAAGVARGADIPIVGLKLIVVDKTMAASTAKAVFVSKDPSITKGAGIDPAQIAATLAIAYDSVNASFEMPQGGNWLVNSASVGKYVNKTAPTAGSVKVSVVKPGSLVKVVAKSLGDVPLDISSLPTGSVYVAEEIANDGETTRLCTQFAGCVHKVIAGGTGYKLVCKGGSTGDPACMAMIPPTTTSTTVATTTTTSSTTSTTLCVPTAEVCGDGLDNDCDGSTDEGCIGDRAWNDLNENGIQGAGEPGLAGATFLLRTSGGALVAVAASNGAGTYWFSNVPAGSYYIEVIPPPAFALVTPDVGSDDTIDSDFDGGSLSTPIFAFPSNGTIAHIDAGLAS